MPETLPQIRPSFNRSLRIEIRPERFSVDAGALVQREMMDRTGTIDWLAERLDDLRNPSSIRHPLSNLLRTPLLLLGQSLARPVRCGPPARRPEPAGGDRRAPEHGAALESDGGLASQPTLSRLLGTVSSSENLRVLHEAVTELACCRIELLEGGRGKKGNARKPMIKNWCPEYTL